MTDRLKTLGDSYDSSSERRRRTSSGEGGEALCPHVAGMHTSILRGGQRQRGVVKTAQHRSKQPCSLPPRC